jgi:hypothetical protein
MSITQTALRAVIAAGATLALTASVAHAVVIEQSQSEGQNMEVSVSTSGTSTGSVTARATGSQSQSQSQRIETAAPVEYVYSHAQYVRGKYVRPVMVRTAWVTPVVMDEGQVRLSWGYRGGTCQVRYTETTRNWYAYATAAGCDDGGITINGLQAGVNYRFQVKPENGVWSRAVVVRAQ